MDTIKKQSFKITVGTIVVSILFIIGTTLRVVAIENKQDKRIDDLVFHCESNKTHIQEIKTKVDSLEIGFHEIDKKWVEIKTKLDNIEALLANINSRN